MDIEEAIAVLSLSVVIPTLNEADVIARTLDSVMNMQRVDEVIVADGGSRDDTIAIAEDKGAKIVTSDAGRGVQLDAGWREVSGELIWMLHADSIPPENGVELIKRAFEDVKLSLTSFSLRFDMNRINYSLLAATANLRTRLFRLPYGDQGLAVRRSDLESVGGLPHWQYLEDVWLARQMTKRGRFRLLPGSVVTSTRRYEQHGFISTIIKHKKVMRYYRKQGRPPEAVR